jgi:hypothetical protein
MSGTMSGAQIVAKILATGLSSAKGLGTADDPVVKDYTQNLANGTGANQASQMFHDQRTLTASSTENIDIQAGTFTNAFGVALAFTKLKALLIFAAVANVNDVLVGGQGANSWVGGFNTTTSVLKVKPGGLFLWTAPQAAGGAVAAGDLLKIANSSSGSSVIYDIVIIGTD